MLVTAWHSPSWCHQLLCTAPIQLPCDELCPSFRLLLWHAAPIPAPVILVLATMGFLHTILLLLLPASCLDPACGLAQCSSSQALLMTLCWHSPTAWQSMGRSSWLDMQLHGVFLVQKSCEKLELRGEPRGRESKRREEGEFSLLISIN